jgi:hypothetical protein
MIMNSKQKKTVRFAPNVRRVFYDPEKTGIQRFKFIENAKTASVNNASVFGPWKKPKGPHYAPHPVEKPFHRKYTVDNCGRVVQTGDVGHRLENILYYQNQISKLAGRK